MREVVLSAPQSRVSARRCARRAEAIVARSTFRRPTARWPVSRATAVCARADPLTLFRSIGPSSGQSSGISYFGGGRRFGLPTAFFFVLPPANALLGARSPFFGEEMESARGDAMITILPSLHPSLPPAQAAAGTPRKPKPAKPPARSVVAWWCGQSLTSTYRVPVPAGAPPPAARPYY